MEIKPVTTGEYNLRYRVKGKSIIDHSIRVEMKLSLEEYVLLDFIHTWNLHNTAPILVKDYYYATGIINEDLIDLFQRLKDRGMICKHHKKDGPDVTQRWKDLFNTDGQFEEMWTLHRKGNKATAKDRFFKVIKKIEYQELKAKLIAYLKNCDEYNIFKKGLDVWLNPEREHWNNPLETRTMFPKRTQQNQPSIPQTRFKASP